MTLAIRRLDPVADRAAVAAMLAEAADYYDLWLGHAPGAAEVAGVFSAGPPGCDAARSYRLGLFDGGLVGVAELSFGFPDAMDAYLGLMILSPMARGRGYGAQFLGHIEGLARARDATGLYLGVLDRNPRGRAFWERMGFRATGVTRVAADHGPVVHRLGKVL